MIIAETSALLVVTHSPCLHLLIFAEPVQPELRAGCRDRQWHQVGASAPTVEKVSRET